MKMPMLTLMQPDGARGATQKAKARQQRRQPPKRSGCATRVALDERRGKPKQQLRLLQSPAASERWRSLCLHLRQQRAQRQRAREPARQERLQLRQRRVQQRQAAMRPPAAAQ
jgi:hypothetical protein